MIKDKIIELENGTNYYILEDITYDNRKYVLAAMCDLENDDLKNDNYYVMEVKINNYELYLNQIEDDNITTIVSKLLLEKARG